MSTPINPPSQTLNKKYVLVDTCVIQAAGSREKQKSETVIKCLADLNKEGFSLAISEVSLYENLQGLWGKKAEEAANILGTYEQKVVSNKVLIVASVFGGLYHSEKIEGPSMADKIIASTALLEKGLILTENHRDFPNPFFIMERHIPLSYSKNHHTRTIDLALYRPHYKIINSKVAENEKVK